MQACCKGKRYQIQKTQRANGSTSDTKLCRLTSHPRPITPYGKYVVAKGYPHCEGFLSIDHCCTGSVLAVRRHSNALHKASVAVCRPNLFQGCHAPIWIQRNQIHVLPIIDLQRLEYSIEIFRLANLPNIIADGIPKIIFALTRGIFDQVCKGTVAKVEDGSNELAWVVRPTC